jgi:ATP-binding cassette subfamily C protein/ATP-binding cassette subfamily C exporter for protease/lipase/ATP-binding cassette subfamily C protein EexD
MPKVQQKGLHNAPTELQRAMSSCRSAFRSVATFSFVINILMLASPVYMLQIYDRVLTSGHVDTLYLLTAIIGIALLLMGALDAARTAVTVRIGNWLTDTLGPVYLASGVRARLQGESSSSELLRDLSQIQNFIATQGLTAFFDSPWVPIYILFIWLLHPALGMVALVSAGTLFLLTLMNEAATRRQTDLAHREQVLSFHLAEAVMHNAAVVWAMGMLPAVIDRWRKTNGEALKALRRSSERGGIILAFTKFLRFFVQIAILGVGALLVLRGELTAGGMIAASILLGRALAPVEMAMSAWRNFAASRQAYGRLKKQLEDYPTADGRAWLPAPKGRIVVEDVVFTAPRSSRLILFNVSFTLEPGEAIAMLGPSGAGKSTLCRLLVGIGSPKGGSIRLDGSELTHWDPVQLGDYIGYLPQDVELFAGTVSENIARMGKIQEREVVRAARLAHAHEMIQSLPEGYSTQIGDGGMTLSAGQRQRLGLARAVYGNPRLIILDEPNANLDEAGEAALAAAVGELKRRGAGLIVVGHRPSTLAQADRILVLKDGCVALFGPREQALQQLQKLRGNAAAGRDSGAVMLPRTVRNNDEQPRLEAGVR